MSIWFEESIPIEKAQFTQILRNGIPPSERESFDHFSRLLDHYVHCKFQHLLGKLYEYYEPFNPNASNPISLEEGEEEMYATNLIDEYKKFLQQAQYQPIGEHDIRDILQQSETRDIKVIFPVEKYCDFLVYFRDEGRLVEYARSWRTLWLKAHPKEIPYYKRLAILFRPFRKTFKKGIRSSTQDDIASELRDITLPQPIVLKLFQNIRRDYLPIIFPGIFLKISLKRKLYIATFLLLSIVLAIVAAALAPSWWYSLLTILPFGVFLKNILNFDKQNVQYYRKLLSYFYHKNVSNNSGVLSYLIDRIAEETYKQNFLVLYAFWNKGSWAFHPISLQSLSHYLQHFLLEFFGVKAKFNLESLLPELFSPAKVSNPSLPPLLKPLYAPRSYLKKDCPQDSCWMDVEAAQIPLPRAGMLEISPGTNRALKKDFFRDESILHIQEKEGLLFSHPAGSAIRWMVEKPYKAKLAEASPKNSDYFLVPQEDAQRLPLHGIGKVAFGEETFEFRYHRNRNDNRLLLVTGLRYRHVRTEGAHVLVRPVFPSFQTESYIAESATKIAVPGHVIFPDEGLIKISSRNDEQIVPYRISRNKESIFLHLMEETRAPYDAQSKVSLTPPVTCIKYNVARNSWLLPIKETKYFSKRGVLILSPGSEQEERIAYRGQSFVLSLDRPLQHRHARGSIVQFKGASVKTNLIDKVARGSQTFMVQGIAEEIPEGQIVVEPGEQFSEERRFQMIEKYFELSCPTQFSHPAESEVWESRLESPLRYDAFQGSYLITVEDASCFPLSGTLEIHFNGSVGVKEVFPFVRTQCSNTLMLKGLTPKDIPEGSSVTVTAVEVTSDLPFLYHENQIKADFSCVDDFPQEGRAIIEPGSSAEETVSFQQYPNRIYFKKPLPSSYSMGTAVDFSSYHEYRIMEPLRANQDRIFLDFAHLLPAQGCLYLRSPNGEVDQVWYRKIPKRIILNEPCRFHHAKETRVSLPHVSNISLVENVERGGQIVRVSNAQDLPDRGKIRIQGLFHTIEIEFIRELDMLYLQHPLPYAFSSHAKIKMPDFFLNNHVSPGMDYVEVSDSSFLPVEGEILLEGSGKVFRRVEKEERISYVYRPDTLWLDKPLQKRHNPETVVFSYELLMKGAGILEARTREECIEKLEKSISSLYLRYKMKDDEENGDKIGSITQNYFGIKQLAPGPG